MKEHPRLTLGEDFAQEKSWQWEDITVLTARLTLPQTKGESRREKRFDRYYRALADAYFARCEQKLLPDAAKTCRAAMARSAPYKSLGSRRIPFSRELYIEREDFMEEPPRKYFRLFQGNEERLMNAYFVKCTGF